MSSFECVMGVVDEVEDHYVATVYVGSLPIVPLRSMYVHRMEMQRIAGGTSIRYEGRDLPLVWSSVILGYLRVYLGFAGFAMPFVLMWGQNVDFSNWTRWECLATYATFAVWGLTFLPGRASAKTKKELAVLGRATGAYLDPRRDNAIGRQGVVAMLEPSLRAMGVEPDAKSLRAAIAKTNDPVLLGKIYAFGRYAAPESADFTPVVTEAWAKLERG